MAQNDNDQYLIEHGVRVIKLKKQENNNGEAIFWIIMLILILLALAGAEGCAFIA